MRTALFALLLLVGCGDSSPPPTKVANQPLSNAVMRAMFTPGQACIRKHRGTMPASYVAQAHIARDRDGYLTLELRSGDRIAPATVRRLTSAAVELDTELGDPTKAASKG